jgi:hypothetical protein
MSKEFLYDYQLEAVRRMKNGCILNEELVLVNLEPLFIIIFLNKVVV